MTMVLSAAMVLSMSVCSFAGVWQQDATGYWWQRDDGSYPAGGWEWIDDNGNGMAECYYFDPNGYCLISTVTPDGYTVDVNGAWVVDDVIQMQAVNNGTGSTAASSDSAYGNALPIPTGQVLDLKCIIPDDEEIFTELYLNPDGTFTGRYIHYRMRRGYVGTGMDGEFTNIQKIDDSSYSMILGNLNTYPYSVSPYEEYEYYGNSDGLYEGNHYILYLPGAYMAGSYVLQNVDRGYTFIQQ